MKTVSIYRGNKDGRGEGREREGEVLHERERLDTYVG